jgi:hypothetical protein
MKRRRAIVIAAVVLVAAGGAGLWLLAADGSGTASADDEAGTPASTATVERRDLVEAETFEGSLGFDDERPLTSARPGTLTALADEGRQIHRGGLLFEVNERPTVLMFGEVPAWRALGAGLEGVDVRQLQRNLLALGYKAGGGLEVDGDFDSATAEAVRDWQDDLGLDHTGTVELGDVVFLPGSRRMGQHTIETGGMAVAGAQVAVTTSIERAVTLNLDATDQDLVHAGDHVEVTLPSGRTVDGSIAEVGRVAESDPTDPTADPRVEIAITIRGEVGTRLDEAPVDVDVETDRASGMLAVPVEALLALAEGGYALEVVDGAGSGGTHLVAVETGSFADGWVEISGDGITEGVKVVTAA